jgi:hypothetical protein
MLNPDLMWDGTFCVRAAPLASTDPPYELNGRDGSCRCIVGYSYNDPFVGYDGDTLFYVTACSAAPQVTDEAMVHGIMCDCICPRFREGRPSLVGFSEAAAQRINPWYG